MEELSRKGYIRDCRERKIRRHLMRARKTSWLPLEQVEKVWTEKDILPI